MSTIQSSLYDKLAIYNALLSICIDLLINTAEPADLHSTKQSVYITSAAIGHVTARVVHQAPSSEVFEDMPLTDCLTGLCKHFIPMLDFHWTALGAEYHLTDLLITSHPVVVHDADDQCCLADPLIWNIEVKRLIEDWIKSSFLGFRLLLLGLLAIIHHPYLHVRIWKINIILHTLLSHTAT